MWLEGFVDGPGVAEFADEGFEFVHDFWVGAEPVAEGGKHDGVGGLEREDASCGSGGLLC